MIDEYETREWLAGAACLGHDPAIFVPLPSDLRRLGYHDRDAGLLEQEAKAVCRECPVVDDCLDYAMQVGNTLEGVWGGTSAVERRRRLRTR